MTAKRIIPLAVIVVTAGLLVAQPPAPPKDKPMPKADAKPAVGGLEDTLEKCLRNSADIKAAEAKVREAEAELNRVRHSVLTKATALHNDLQLAKRMLGFAEETYANLAKGLAGGAIDAVTLIAARTAVENQRGEVDKIETDLKSLRGEFEFKLTAETDARIRAWDVTFADSGVRLWTSTLQLADKGDAILSGTKPDHPERGVNMAAVSDEMGDRVLKLLDMSLEDLTTLNKFEDTIVHLFEITENVVPYKILGAKDLVCVDEIGFPKGKTVTVAAALQSLEDSCPDLRIVIRDYGFLFTTRDRMPDGAIRVRDFYKAAKEYAKKKSELKSQPMLPAKK